MTIEEKAGDMLSFLMEEVIPESEGKDFVRDSIAILTCCISAIIREGTCGDHKSTLVENVGL